MFKHTEASLAAEIEEALLDRIKERALEADKYPTLFEAAVSAYAEFAIAMRGKPAEIKPWYDWDLCTMRSDIPEPEDKAYNLPSSR